MPRLTPRTGANGVRLFREITIPLPYEHEFNVWWKTSMVAAATLGWWVGERNGLPTLYQWLMTDGKPTPAGIARVRDLTAPQQQLLALENAPLDLQPLPPEIEKLLRGYQITPARQLLRALTKGPEEWGFAGAFDGSATGTGKTYTGLATAIAYGRKPVILCPVVGKSAWERGHKHFGIEPYAIETYEACRGGWRSSVVEESDGRFRWKNASEILLIMDEAQAVRNPETINFQLCAAAIQQGIPIIASSATVAEDPRKLRFVARITGLHKGGHDWIRFLMEHGCRRKGEGWEWDGKPASLARIHQRLLPRRGCRMKMEDMGAEAPETTISVLPLDVPEAKDLERRWIIRRKTRMAVWQACEWALVPAVAEKAWIDLRAGRSVVIFCNFDRSRHALATLLKTEAGFYGAVSLKKRQYWEAEFQADRQRVLVNNIVAGGASVSLHDLHGDHPRSAYIFPTDNPVPMQQAFGRVARMGAVTPSEQWIPCIAGTVSMRMVNRTREKILSIETINDGAAESRF